MTPKRIPFPIFTSNKLSQEQQAIAEESLRQSFNDILSQDIENAFGTSTSTASADHPEWDNTSLDAMIETMYPTLYYETSQWMKKHEIALLAAWDRSPEFLLFHPDHEEVYLKDLSERRTMVRLSEYNPPKPEQKYCRLLDGRVAPYDAAGNKMGEYNKYKGEVYKFQHIGKGFKCSQDGELDIHRIPNVSHFFKLVRLTDKDKRKMNYRPRKKRSK